MWRDHFPVLQSGLCYLDSAATTLKPTSVTEKEHHFLTHSYANVHRSAYKLGYEASVLFEKAREDCARFIGADPSRFIWTAGATAGLNFVAQSYLRGQLKQGDNIVITIQEHHANWLPWWQLAKEIGAECRVVLLTETDQIDYEHLIQLVDHRTKLVSVSHVSNVTGAIIDIAKIRDSIPKDTPLCVDGAQALGHMKVDVSACGADFYVGSAHKMYGPNGLGFVAVSERCMSLCTRPILGGGMVSQVGLDGSVSFLPGPSGYEAGTQHISGVIGMAAAVEFIEHIGGMAAVIAHEKKLLSYALSSLRDAFPELIIKGHQNGPHVGVISWVWPDAHPHDIATFCDSAQVALRAGHHCAMPLMQYWQVPATTRISLGCYNNEEDIDRLVGALHQVRECFGVSV